MMLGGLWCSTQKPPAFTFLESIFTSLNEMNVTGTHVLLGFMCVLTVGDLRT